MMIINTINRQRYSRYTPSIRKQIGGYLELYGYYHGIVSYRQISHETGSKSLIEPQFLHLENTKLQPENTNYNVLQPSQLHFTCENGENYLEKREPSDEPPKIHIRIKVKKIVTEIE